LSCSRFSIFLACDLFSTISLSSPGEVISLVLILKEVELECYLNLIFF
jgi:hypothetical protein